MADAPPPTTPENVKKRALRHAALWQYHPTVVEALLRRLEKRA
jgi:hypothetical protein